MLKDASRPLFPSFPSIPLFHSIPLTRPLAFRQVAAPAKTTQAASNSGNVKKAGLAWPNGGSDQPGTWNSAIGSSWYYTWSPWNVEALSGQEFVPMVRRFLENPPFLSRRGVDRIRHRLGSLTDRPFLLFSCVGHAALGMEAGRRLVL